MRRFVWLMGLASIGGLGACVSPSPAETTPSTALQAESAEKRAEREGLLVSQRVIIRFKNATTEAEARALLPELNAQLGCDLVYVRPMSAGVHLLRLSSPLDAPAFDSVLRRLSADPAVDYAEPDRLVTIHR
ncbi:MAG: hypothetical protein AB1717_06850 [Pseudomonadota bacterium]